MGMDGRFRASKGSQGCRGSLGPSGGAERCKELLNNFGTSSFSILLCLGGGEGGRRSGNMGAAAFGATVAGAHPPQTIVVGGAAGGTMEGTPNTRFEVPALLRRPFWAILARTSKGVSWTIGRV